MILDLEKQKEHFKNHVATFTDYGNIKILDFKNPESIEYRIRFLFEEDYYRLHISGDLGELIACNYKNMCYEKFDDFQRDSSYFEGKIICHNRAIYCYDKDKAKSDLIKAWNFFNVKVAELYSEDEDEAREELIERLLDDFTDRDGFGSKACDILYDIDPECFDYIDDIGKEETGILELYMLAFELAQEQLKEQKNE